MIDKEGFLRKIRELGALAGELEALPANGNQGAARELVQLLMEVHATGLERLLEIVFESGAPGEAIIQRAGADPVVRQLLLLYSLHPEDLETRVLQALDGLGPRLRKHNSEVELLGIHEGVVRIRIQTTGHACGSTARTIQTIVEEGIYDLAPDLTSLEIVRPEDEASSGFVSLESLMKKPFPASAAVRGVEVLSVR